MLRALVVDKLQHDISPRAVLTTHQSKLRMRNGMNAIRYGWRQNTAHTDASKVLDAIPWSHTIGRACGSVAAVLTDDEWKSCCACLAVVPSCINERRVDDANLWTYPRTRAYGLWRDQWRCQSHRWRRVSKV